MRDGGMPGPVLRVLHGEPPGRRRGGAGADRAALRVARGLPVPWNAPLRIERPARRSRDSGGGRLRRARRVRALRRADGGDPQETGAGLSLRNAILQPAGAARTGATLPGAEVRGAAFRRRLPAGGVDAGRPLPQRLPGHLKQQFLDAVRRAGSEDRVPAATRLLFGTASSYFPRGWNYAIFEAQTRALLDLGISAADARLIIGENLSRLFAG